MPVAKLFCTAFGTVLFLYQGERSFNQTPCHCWQVAVQPSSRTLFISQQAIPCEAEREPGLEDAEAIAMMLARRAGYR
ncbi:hypothetical protein [Gloeobacter kilaueensis]|uniref:Uncharacterized protein n=1 Tax=Gloeobacter kilaueensis (strain ATCC BAA-2537 / CCAP 1431/1 / ULC 316 / JS1) TaxID=1183438 RepID=U5QMC7_GLOK1|nr:hypothetical protein [Gloeobacter kilaueensis]AGY60071.1 hypothetical protein GKIL_3825 [Gloeobacter kilaueensis JS1]